MFDLYIDFSLIAFIIVLNLEEIGFKREEIVIHSKSWFFQNNL